MTTRRPIHGQHAQRGEGNAKFIIYLLVLGVVGYLGIVNIPRFFSMQNLKADAADLARTTGVAGIAVDKVRYKADELARKYDIPPQDIKVQQEGRGIAITVNTVKKIDLIVTEYDWVVLETTKQVPY